jgi:hypothetical protein
VLAVIELARIQRGTAPVGGRFLTLVGLFTALAGLGLFAALFSRQL